MPRHVAQNHQLLVVLLAEQRYLRLHDIEQLEDHRGDATEMTGTELAIELILDFGRVDVILLRLWIEIGLRGCKQQVDAGRGEFVAVGHEGAWIAVEVVVRPELKAVHENRGDDCVAVRARIRHQGDVARVQVAHRRHHGDTTTMFQRCAQFGNRRMDLHGYSVSNSFPDRGSCRP